MYEGSNKKRVKVEIFGDIYTIKGDTHERQMQLVAEYVDRKMQYVAQRTPSLSLKQVAVLAALNIADELFTFKNDYDKLVQILEEDNK
ncbi:cell division protein ZapA [Desulfonispora thiosulfatigenes DSM 11270]|uniref:Cell division protein ZapA n=1 Tax=Desulfonispora thiosulfatigenes DSM 11270 TaxID=656914 RepID=A0A1W1VRG9_DESTI|nr:cell division protein ZapA [Desulfonispora thiosulfatigenes]SMB95972.1 cell division protein ZapA [Desulfonispora thiosulfatigenes DSM 11270]